MAIKRFDINNKPLNKAKSCIFQLMRDDGSIEWYEDCKAGQLMQIKSGMQKVYINLDYNKLKNFNIKTDESKLEEIKSEMENVEKIKEELKKKIEIETKKHEEELGKLIELKDIKIKGKKEEYLKNAYEKKIESLNGKYIKLSKNKIKNFGNENKPILGFIGYEKEFNVLPYKAEHDSKAITQWMDDILKNKKDFQAQRTEAVGKVFLYILIGLAVFAFIFFRYGAPFFEKAKAEEVVPKVAEITMMLPIFTKEGIKWLKKGVRKLLKKQ